MQEQNPDTICTANNSIQQHAKIRFFEEMQVEIQFEEEKSIHLQECHLHVSEQSSIIISHQSSLKERTKTKKDTLELEIPFASILCLGKKSSTTTLLMLKDKDKEVERDEDGYELVSDEEDEEFEDKTNPLYTVIDSAINQKIQNPDLQQKGKEVLKRQTRIIRMDQKCNILITVNPQLQCTQTQSTTPSPQLYKYLSEEMQKFQITVNQKKGEWTNRLSQLQAVQFREEYGQENQIEDEENEDYEDYEEDSGREDADDQMEEQANVSKMC